MSVKAVSSPGIVAAQGPSVVQHMDVATPSAAAVPPLQSALRGSSAVANFSALVCFLDGVLLAVVALMQLSAGGLGILIGLWNLAATGVYIYVAWGLSKYEVWSYNAGIGLGLANLLFVFFQLQLLSVGSMLGASISDEAAMIPLMFMGGDLFFVIVLFATKNAIFPPPPPAAIPVPQSLLSELDQAIAMGWIHPEEKALMAAAYQGFVSKLKESRSLRVDTNLHLGGESVEVRAFRMVDYIFARGASESQFSRLYLFRAYVDKDVMQWMRSTVWKEMYSPTVIVCLDASSQARATAGKKFFKGSVGLYMLRENKEISGGDIKEFSKIYRQTTVYAQKRRQIR